jgi:tRNA (adenine22-N1)-methyltransferase
MTRQPELRRYLCENGFSVLNEAYSYEAGKYYVCINASYTGECRKLSDFEAEFGNLDPRVEFSPEKKGYIETKLRAIKRALNGKIKGGGTADREAALIREYNKLFKEGE